LLHLTWFEFFVRSIPESFFIVLLVYAFSKQKVDKKRYILASLLYAVLVFAVRELPIIFGIHTFIVLFVLIVITCYINKIKVIVSFRSSILTMILLYICELVNIFFVQYVFHLNIEKMYTDVYIKTLYSLPSLLLIAVVSIFAYYMLVVNKRKKGVI